MKPAVSAIDKGAFATGTMLCGATLASYALRLSLFGLDDKFIHLTFFAGLAFLIRSLGVRERSAALLLFSASWALEFAQLLWLDRSDFSVIDGLASVLGALVGLTALRLCHLRAHGLVVGLLGVLGASLIGDGAYQTMRPFVVSAALHNAYRRAVGAGQPSAPWIGAPANIAARLDIPRLGLQAPIADDAGAAALAMAPGFWRLSPAPMGPGVSIILGHRDGVFHTLGRVRLNDEVVLRLVDAAPIHLVVRDIRVTADESIGVRPWRDPTGVALVTCWPLTRGGPNRQRLVVLLAPARRQA